MHHIYSSILLLIDQGFSVSFCCYPQQDIYHSYVYTLKSFYFCLYKFDSAKWSKRYVIYYCYLFYPEHVCVGGMVDQKN